MIFLKLVRYIKGYVRFSISGDFPERLLNQLSANHLSVWNVVRKKENIDACILASQYKRIRHLRRKNKVITKVNGKFGFPFFVLRHKNRKGIVAGIVIFFVILQLLSGRIWYVKVTGNDYIKTDEILKAAYQSGIYEGMSNKNINSVKLKSELGNRITDASRIAVNVEYCRLTLEISEKRITPEQAKDTPCNLVASTDGVITKLLVTEGKKIVKTGQAVEKGELLVSGTIEYKGGNTGFKHSAGEVLAKTEKTITVEQPLEFVEYVYTGEKIERQVLELFGLKIPLFLGEVTKQYDRETDSETFGNSDFVLPIKLYSADFKIKIPRTIVLDEVEAKIMAEEKMSEREKELLENCEVIDCETYISTKNKKVVISKTFQCIENIAKEEKIIINTTK